MLTKRQEAILTYIKKNANFTMQSIADELNLNSRSTIHAHIKALEKHGYLKQIDGNYIVCDLPDESISYIQFHGYAQCGYNGVFLEEDAVDFIPFPSKFLPRNTTHLVAIKAKGDSMEPTISDDELLIFDQSLANDYPRENDVLLCNLDGEIKIKRFSIRQNIPMLISDNKSQFEPIELDETNNLKILGKLIRLKPF